MDKKIENIIVIFGATGNLATNKLFPALHCLYSRNKLPENIKIIGAGRNNIESATFCQQIHQLLQNCDTPSQNFCNHLSYMKVDPENQDDFILLKKHLSAISSDKQNIIFHLATPPSAYKKIIIHLANVGLSNEQNGSRRIIIEKPFGNDLVSSQDLDQTLLKYFTEKQIFRIDHYLGKETVQNLLVFRFSNAIFEPLWNRNYIDYVEISCAEKTGIDKRGLYYDHAGATADMLQSHMLQLLAMTTMEPPACFDANSIRNESVKVLQCLRHLDTNYLNDNMILGQYSNANISGQEIKGYTQENNIPPNSKTETFIAIKLFINNWRWNGVPFYMRTGKRMPTKVTEIVIHFKNTPHPVFGVNPPDNKLILRIEPNEGIVVQFGMKKPGEKFDSTKVSMDFHYKDLGNIEILSPYERLLKDAVSGDATLYMRTDAVEESWQFVEPILQYKHSGKCPVYTYPSGNWGPPQADELLNRDNRKWRYPCKNLNDNDNFCEL